MNMQCIVGVIVAGARGLCCAAGGLSLVLLGVVASPAQAANIEFLVTYEDGADAITYGDTSATDLNAEHVFKITDCVFESGNCSLDATPSGLGVTATPQINYPYNTFNPTTRGVTSGPDTYGYQFEQVEGYADLDDGNDDDFAVDALHQISTTQYLTSFQDDETINSVTYQDEDIVLRNIDGTTSLIANVTPFLLEVSGGGKKGGDETTVADVNAVHAVNVPSPFDDTLVDDLLVSFDDTITFANLGCSMSLVCDANLNSGVTSTDIVRLSVDGSTKEITAASLFLSDPDNLLLSDASGGITGFAIDPRYNLGGDTLITIFLTLGDTTGFNLRGGKDAAPTILSVQAYGGATCTTSDYCVVSVSSFLDVTKGYLNANAPGKGDSSNAASRRLSGLSLLFGAEDVPEPGMIGLLALGGVGVALVARRRRTRANKNNQVEQQPAV